MGENVFVGADKNKILNPLKVGAHDGDATGEADFRVAADQSSGCGCRRLNVDQIEVKIVFFKSAGLASDPRERLRNRRRGVKTDELVRAMTAARSEHGNERDYDYV